GGGPGMRCPAHFGPASTPSVHRSTLRFSVDVVPLEVNENHAIVPHNPGVVSGRDHRHVTRPDLFFRAIIHSDSHPPLDHVAHVGHLAALGSCDRFDTL